jgi:hypothetical protein
LLTAKRATGSLDVLAMAAMGDHAGALCGNRHWPVAAATQSIGDVPLCHTQCQSRMSCKLT